MPIISNVKRFYSKIDEKIGGILPGGYQKQEPITKVNTSYVEAQELEPVKSIDYVNKSGQGSGAITIKGSNVWSGSGGGGSGVSVVSTSFDEPTTTKLIEAQGYKIQSSTSQNSNTLQNKITALDKSPVGTLPKVYESPWYKTAFYGVKDTVSGLTGGVWLEHFGRSTALTSEQIKKRFKESVLKNPLENINKYKKNPVLTFLKRGQDKKGLIGGFQEESIKSAVQIRRSGQETTASQKKQIEAITGTAENINKFQKELEESAFYTEKKELSKDVKNLEFELQEFNAMYTNKALNSVNYEKAIKRQAELEKKRQEVLTKQEGLQSKYITYESKVISEIQNLRKLGVTTKTQEGNLMFTSKELEKIVSPVGLKLQKSYLSPSGKVTYKNILYGGGAIAHTTAESYGAGLTVGLTGALAQTSRLIDKLPKFSRITAKALLGGSVVAGVGLKTYSGYKMGEQLKIGKIGAIVGGLSATGQVIGFSYGGYKGTKSYYKNIENKIIQGKYTKSIAETRTGKLISNKGSQLGGKASQIGKYETKIKGTDYKIESMAKASGKYGKSMGESDINIYSEFKGKTPRGYPKQYVTKGKTLETSEFIKGRLYTKSSKTKNWYSQDVLLKRTFLKNLNVNVQGKQGFKGYNKLEKLDFLTGLKSTTKPIKIKQIPQDIFTSGEKYLFRVEKTKYKVAGYGEYKDAEALLMSRSKQYVLYKTPKSLGDFKIIEFDSLAKTKGLSADLLKQSLKQAFILSKSKAVNFAKINKRGQLLTPSLEKSQIQEITKIKAPIQEIRPQDLRIDIKKILSLQLTKIAPGLLSKQLIAITPTALELSGGIVGLKNIMDVKIKNVSIPSIKLREIQQLNEAQLTRLSPLLKEVTPQLTRMSTKQIITPVLATPINPATISPVTSKTIIPIIAPPILPDLSGYMRKQARAQLSRMKQKRVYTESFTPRLLDLEKKIISKSQAKKLLGKTFTGLELRRGVIVR